MTSVSQLTTQVSLENPNLSYDQVAKVIRSTFDNLNSLPEKEQKSTEKALYAAAKKRANRKNR